MIVIDIGPLDYSRQRFKALLDRCVEKGIITLEGAKYIRKAETEQ